MIGRRILRRCYLAWDALYARLHRLHAVDDIVLIGRGRHGGQARTFEDGTELLAGDAVAILHFSNRNLWRLRRGAADSRRPAAVEFGIHLLRSMRSLAEAFDHNPDFNDIAVLTGITWFRPHGGSIGFSAEPLPPGPRRAWLKLHFRVLLRALFPDVARRENRRLVPHRFWLTRRQLFRTLEEEDNHVARRLAQRSPSRSAL